MRILDFPHAAQRITSIAEGFVQAERPLPVTWLSEQSHRLKHEGGEAVLSHLRSLPELEGVSEHRQYLEKRVALMQYPDYQAAGLPLGSGMVESASHPS